MNDFASSISLARRTSHLEQTLTAKLPMPRQTIQPPSLSEGTQRPVGLRARKMQRQRELLIDIGVNFFCKKGFEATSLAEIIDVAEVSERTFFRYFKSKEDLVFDWNDMHNKILLPIITAHPKNETTCQTMRRALLALVEEMNKEVEANLKMCRLIFESPTLKARAYWEVAKWQNQFCSALTGGRKVSAGKEFETQVDVALSVAAFLIAIQKWAHSEKPANLRSLVESALARI